MINLNHINYNPDILSCLANLSSDEVFTPPWLVNQMLDMLPSELWSNKNAIFLDPCTKSGVYLREIAKRLNEGLKDDIPILQERLNHIFQNQIYGIAITELTSLLAKRSLYCSRKANGEYSIAEFDNENGNIYFRPQTHNWGKDERCTFCGANKANYEREKNLEAHAYNFIHSENLNEFFNMRFDVIIGNPPYQLNDGGAQASASPLYHYFVEKSIILNPKYLIMITPSRWFAGGKGLDNFRKNMLNDDRLRIIHDYPSASDCFPGVEIKGGVSYFLWDRDNRGKCKVISHSKDKISSEMERDLLENGSDIFIRMNEAVSIYNKVKNFNEVSLSTIVSSRKPFGLATNFTEFKDKYFENSISLYANQKRGYVAKDLITENKDWISKIKVIIPEAIGIGNVRLDKLKPIITETNSACTETYIVCGVFDDLKTAENMVSYINTKFFHLLLSLRKITQHTTSQVYSFIPIQNFNEEWTDAKLYDKYNLTEEEINFIENTVWSGGKSE